MYGSGVTRFRNTTWATIGEHKHCSRNWPLSQDWRWREIILTVLQWVGWWTGQSESRTACWTALRANCFWWHPISRNCRIYSCRGTARQEKILPSYTCVLSRPITEATRRCRAGRGSRPADLAERYAGL